MLLSATKLKRGSPGYKLSMYCTSNCHLCTIKYERI